MKGLQIFKAGDNSKQIAGPNGSYEVKVLDDKLEVIHMETYEKGVIICQPYECDDAINYYYILKGAFENHEDKTVLVAGDSFSVKNIKSSVFLKALEDSKVLWVVSKSVYHEIHFEREKIEELLKAIQEKDHYTQQHCRRVANLASEIARRVKLTDKQVVNTINAATCHDIGKLNVSTEILNKPSSLTKEEFDIMRKHANDGYEIISSEFDAEVAKIVAQHHERLDGSGYPLGLHGDEIRIEARIIAVADSYDAMITDRPYKKGMKPSAALQELKMCTGSFYDQEIVNAFEKYLMEHEIEL